MSRRILVAMSGGVDSSVAAALLVEAGHEVIGVTMKTFCYDETQGPSRTCCGLDGILDARSVADRLGIRHLVFDVEEEFTRDVIDDFVDEYAAGRTPNPCVRCNSNTKFRDLLARGRALGCDGIATGHYVRTEHSAEGSHLLRGEDSEKDQAYFLWGLPRAMIPQLHFPLGSLTKPQVRELARERGFITADKPESQEICFVPSGDYREFLSRKLRPRHPALEPGDLVTSAGEVVGRHDGYAGFTVGQRRGLGGGFPRPYFVIEIRPESREVVVGPREELTVDGLEATGANWIADQPEPHAEVEVQIRHRGRGIPARIESIDEGRWTCRFRSPEPAVTPGQSAVVFSGSRLLGGGRIERTLRPDPEGARNDDQYRRSALRAKASMASRSEAESSSGMSTRTSTN
ncbi:MAG: tRNA 2-thiouridine(34) synthase MnmA [Gemmatimonadales bacterium]|nr:MAG: tRNA 2-thiouridine(34) synthase MnmA [Gemmatimonadales bacterium]